MALSFHEKSLWLMLASLIACFGFYFSVALPVHGTDVMPHQIFLFGVATVFLVITQVVGHTVIALVERRTDTDERDQLIALKANRNGSFVLATGVFFSLCAAAFTKGNFIFAHVLLAFWVLAQLVDIASQLVLQRRGA